MERIGRIAGKILIGAGLWICLIVAVYAGLFLIALAFDGVFHWQLAVTALGATALAWYLWSPVKY